MQARCTCNDRTQAGLRDALANGELRRQLLDARRDMARNAAAARAQVLAGA